MTRVAWFFREKLSKDAEDRIATLSRRLDDVESAFRKVRAEWTDAEERMSRIAGRLAKRAARELERLDPPPPDEARDRAPPDEVALRRQRRVFPNGSG